MRRSGSVLFLGPIAPITNGHGKKSYTFSTLQADGGLIQLEYPNLQAAGAARSALAEADGAVVVNNAKLFAAIVAGMNEARAVSSQGETKDTAENAGDAHCREA